MSDHIPNEDIQKAKEAGIRFYTSQEEKNLAYLKEGMARTDKEKFLFLMNLMRLERIMKRTSRNKISFGNFKISNAMERTYIKPPQTLMEVYQMLPEGTNVQLINNQIIMSPAPSDAHQKILDKIYRRLGDYVEEKNLGETRPAPYDVYLSRKNAYQPDIVFIAGENLHKIQADGLHGAPDLVIEILSPATWHYDKGDKKDEYERSGVKEYWLVDPIDKTTEGFQLVNHEFLPLPAKPGMLSLHLLNCTISF